MANWKEGIDWVTDPTGATIKSDHIFVAPFGDDVTGDGTPDTPYETISKAIAESGTDTTVVLYTGQYSENFAWSNDKVMQGDGYVLLTGNISIPGASKSKFYDCIFKGCNISTSGEFSIYRSILLNVIIGTTPGGITFEDLIFINSQFTTDGGPAPFPIFNRNIWINSTLTANGSKLVTRSSYFDENSSIILTSGFSSSLEISSCDIEGTVSVGGVSLDPTINNSNVQNNISESPLFNNPEGGDFSLSAGSPLFGAGLSGDNIGGTSFGQSYFNGSAWLDAIINSNGNLSYNISTGEIEVAFDTVIESGEFQEANLRYLPRLDLCGFPSPTTDALIALAGEDRLIYECAWAGLDGVYGDWERFRFGETPTVDTLGNYNGEVDYRWGELEKIIAYKRKYRFTFRANGL